MSSHDRGDLSAGKRLVQEPLHVIDGAVVTDGSNSTTTFETDLPNANNDFYNNLQILFTGGDNDGQSRRISDYNGTTKFITVEDALYSTPAGGDTFYIVPRYSEDIPEAADIVDDVWDEAQADHVAVGSMGKQISDIESYVDTMEADLTTEIDANETKIDTIDGYHDVATADATTNAVMSDVIGNKTDAAIQDGDSTTKTIMALLKGIHDALFDTDGINSWPAANPPGDWVSIAEVIRYIYSEQLGTEFDGSPDLYDTIVTGYDSSSASANKDGSIIERLEIFQRLFGSHLVYTADAGTVNTITDAALTATDDLYNGMLVVMMSGTYLGLARYVYDYDGTGKVLYVAPDFPGAISTDQYSLVPRGEASWLDQAGHGLQSIFDTVDAIPDLTRVGDDHDQSDAAGTEDTIWTIDAPGGNWAPKTFMIDLTEMVALDILQLKVKYRIESGGSMIVEYDTTFNGPQSPDLISIPLHENRFGIIITTAQLAGTARDFAWEIYYEG